MQAGEYAGRDCGQGCPPGDPRRGEAMQTIQSGYRGLSLLLKINFDRLFVVGTIIVGLLAGAFLGTAIAGL
ncbi:hypothetical protein U879_15035 [Defluviimonas sp. 20V17]|nr:hypothetical protein U879_15035 [Defluviimonas sp. 20V17]